MPETATPASATDPRGLVFITPTAFADMEQWHATVADLRRESPVLDAVVGRPFS